MIKSCYIHIPFCKNICSYCDFCKMYYNKDFIDKYLLSLEKEINLYYKNDLLNTLYIGGGTPSCLNEISLKKLFKIISIFKLNKTYEFTFECNIEDINEKLLIFLKENKVNRISIGLQSFNKKYIEFMNRKYLNKKEITDKINLVKKYFNNINIDLIYGINNETLKELQEEVDSFINLDVNHISLYSLILEDNTILKTKKYKEIDDDLNRKMYDYIRKTLKKNNYIHYEISNFSKKGYMSKHNLCYWNNDNYYGFGLGASGFIDNIRYTNTRSLNSYINGNYRYIKEKIDNKRNMEYEMILNLRKIKGISKKNFYKKYNINIKDVFDVSKLNENKYYFYIPKKYLFVENYILCNFILD